MIIKRQNWINKIYSPIYYKFETVDEFEDELRRDGNIFQVKHFKVFPQEIRPRVNNFLQSKVTVSYDWVRLNMWKTILPYYPRGSNNKHWEFWYVRGHENPRNIVIANQKKNSQKFVEKCKRLPLFSKQMNIRCIEYWMNRKGLSFEEATQKISSLQDTRSIKSIMQRRGVSENEAQKIQQQTSDKWQKTLISKPDYKDICTRKGRTKEQLTQKYGLEQAENIITNRIKRTTGGISVLSQTFIRKLPEICFDGDVFYGKNELCLKDQELNCFYKYDFCNKTKKIIIEFHGDYWHCNPAKFSKDYFNPTTQRYAYEQWGRDSRKKQIAEAEGYTVIIIWESDFNKNVLTGHEKITTLCT